MSDSLPKPTSPNQSTGKTISPASQLPVTSPKETVIKPTATAQPAGVNPALAPKPVAPPLVSKNTPPSLAGSSQPSVLAGAGKPPTQPPSQSSTQPPSPPSGQPPSQLAGQPPVKQPLMAGIKANPRKWIMVVLAVLFGVGLIVFLISRIFAGRSGSAQPSSQTPSPVQQTVIAYWGLWEPTAALEGIISDYETANPGIQIDYRVQSHKDYRERLQTAIASGNGPDIFRYHASWVPMLTADLAVLPANIMSAQEFQNTFYPSAAEQLQVEGRIVGLPLMYDGLVLYYNTQILQTAGVEPPNSWSDLKQLAGELTVPADKSERRRSGIQRSGLAIGNASNIDHFSDILALLILQNGGDPLVPAFTEVRDALLFYTNFITQDQIWDDTLPSSTVAFARGDAAMMFAPSWRAHEIRNLNPQLQFATAPLPQLSEETITWANFWAEGVNERSNQKTAAWNFLKYLTSSEVMQKLYSAQSQVRAFGEPYSRQDLATSLQDDLVVGAVLSDAPFAVSSFMNSATHDNGLNDNIIAYYRTAVNAVLASEDLDEVLLTLERGIQQELKKFGLN